MSPSNVSNRIKLPLDVWVVIVALLLVALVRAGVIKTVPW
jgi:hypothetical protein